MSTYIVVPDPVLPPSGIMQAESISKDEFAVWEKEMDRNGLLDGRYTLTAGGQRRYRYSAWKEAWAELAKIHARARANS